MMTRALVSTAAIGLCAALLTHAQTRTERHLLNVKQLTAGGENAEAYFSADGKQLIYQTNPGMPGTCDQIFTMNVDGSGKRQLSQGGRTTCGYFFPDGKSIVYASTHLGSSECPPRPSYARGYVWPIYDTYEIFREIGRASCREREKSGRAGAPDARQK